MLIIGLFTWHGARVARRLIDVGLFRSPGFRAAALASARLAAALFGTLLALQLYDQSSAAGARCGRGAILPIAGV
jgi:hypothetical protein